MSDDQKVFDIELVLPDAGLSAREGTLLGFEDRYARIRDRLRLLLGAGELEAWNRRHHRGGLAICSLVADQYPFAIFHGDVGTGKTAMAECAANRLVCESRTEDSQLFKLSTRVRGSGKVGEIGSLLAEAFERVTRSAGKGRRAVMIIDEGDSIASARSGEHSHHEDKVAVNALIQGIDDVRRFGGRVVVFLCTNRLSVLDPALRRRAAIIEAFTRPDEDERRALLRTDLGALNLRPSQVAEIAAATGPRGNSPGFTFSDIRTRLYPAALALAVPHDRALGFEDLLRAAAGMEASPAMEDR